MAELIIGAVALGVAGPGIVVAVAQCGEYFREEILKYKNAPEMIQELSQVWC